MASGSIEGKTMVNSLYLDYTGKQEIAQAYVGWLAAAASWRSFITLTYRDPVHPELAMRHIRQIMRRLNEDLYGNRYRRKVGHSYFSYVIGIEYQKRDVLHFHMLVDQYVNYDLLHKYWGNAHGFVWIEPITDFIGALKYVTKYVFKDGTIFPFIRDTELKKSKFHQGTELIKGIT